jgi:sugar-specific transcriptional regulator TrmB
MSQFIDEKEQKEIIKKIVKLGIGERDAVVYIALLGMDKAVGSSKIINKTGLHGQYVYQSLGKLEEKGLVRHVLTSGRKKFSANSPKRLRALVEEKIILADQITEDLQRMHTEDDEQEFEIYQGDIAFVQYELDLLHKADKGSFIDVIGGNGNRYVELFGELQMAEYEKLRVQKGIKNRYIGTESERAFLVEAKKKYKYFDYRIMPGSKEGIVNMAIRPTSVSICVYTNPALTYALYSEEVIKSYRDFFDALWSLSEK